MSLKASFKKTPLYRLFFGHKKYHFLTALAPGSTVLDIGCGNHSPSLYKEVNPLIQYYGVDIEEYNMNEQDYKAAAEITFVDRNRFAESIGDMKMSFDAVISAHNLEHTDEPMKVIDAMMARLKPGGKIYLSFPTEKSAEFPSRKGTLNFYDDKTHNYLPVFKEVIDAIARNGGTILFSRRRYRAPYGFIKGTLQEPASALLKKNYSNTWHFWGFETVIIAVKG